MKILAKAFLVLSIAIFITSCEEDENDFTARRDSSVAPPNLEESTTARTYVGTISGVIDNWPAHDCPNGLGPTGTPEDTTVIVDFATKNFSVSVPENITIPGFNIAFTSKAAAFSHFGRGFFGGITSTDNYGDFRPAATATCDDYGNQGILVLSGLLVGTGDDFSTLTATYYVVSECGGDELLDNPIICQGTINATLEEE